MIEPRINRGRIPFLLPGVFHRVNFQTHHADMDAALYGYNPSDHYVRAITLYAQVMQGSERAYLGYYQWRVYVDTVQGGLFLDAIAGGASDSPFAQLKGRAILAGDWSPSFTVDNVAKDLQLISDAAERAGVATGLVDALLAAYREASAAGHGHQDLAAVYEAFAPNRE